VGGPYLVVNVTNHSAITLQDDDRNVFKANGQRLKIFLEFEILELEEIDVCELSELKPCRWSSPNLKLVVS
jgi:hypothetical protein